MQINVNAFLVSIIKSKKRKKTEQKTSEQVLITPPQNLAFGAPTLCATNTITHIQDVICQRLSRER